MVRFLSFLLCFAPSSLFGANTLEATGDGGIELSPIPRETYELTGTNLNKTHLNDLAKVLAESTKFIILDLSKSQTLDASKIKALQDILSAHPCVRVLIFSGADLQPSHTSALCALLGACLEIREVHVDGSSFSEGDIRLLQAASPDLDLFYRKKYCGAAALKHAGGSADTVLLPDDSAGEASSDSS